MDDLNDLRVECPALYTVYDRVAEEAGPPYVAKNDGVALRAYVKLLADCPVSLRGDYQLYRLAVWNPLTMALVVYNSPELVEMPSLSVGEVSNASER